MRYLTIIFLFITTFATGQQQMFLRSTPAAGVTGILDSYTGAAAAYATALLYSSYGGSCLRVRRDSDDAEQDIGFSGQDIDEAAINSFCSGANCFVKTWHDQSGSGNNATQTDPTRQPKIYDSSTGIIYENSTPAVFLDNANDILELPVQLSATATVFSVFRHNADAQGTIYTGTNGGGDFAYAYRINSGGVSSGLTISSTYKNGVLTSITNQTSVYNAINTGVPLLWTSFFTSVDTARWQLIRLGAAVLFGSSLSWQCVVIYNSDQSANRTGIENAINSYFNIFYINILILLVRLPKRKEKNAA